MCVQKLGNLVNNPSFTIDHCKKKKPPQHLIYDYGVADDAPTVTLISDKERQIDNGILCMSRPEPTPWTWLALEPLAWLS
ncbi:hypothetical protein KY289_023078 [Solanum tuberosum]|nr:hypothetical protein KY289_023078 [Solanum tuberosum]